MRGEVAKFAITFVVMSLLGTSHAYAQNGTAGLVIKSLIGGPHSSCRQIPAGFANYSLGGSLTYNITRLVGVEERWRDARSVPESEGRSANGSVKTPNIATYPRTILSARTGSSRCRTTGGRSLCSRRQR